MEPQPRRYRVRVYDRGDEVLTDRKYPVVLDLTAGPALRETEGKLDALLQTLARANGARGERVAHYHLGVEEWDTGEHRFDWPARTWPEERY